jgi:phosphoribosyl-AMP cyclohydrolase
MKVYSTDVIDDFIAAVRFNEDGLVPVVTQDEQSQQVLMLAWMNAEALRETLTGGRVVYWSRSRQELWRKGDTSGHTQELVDIRLDCDGDALLLQVHQHGPACHTGKPSCFFVSPASFEKRMI